MQVTSIQIQKKRGDRVSVFLDQEFWTGMSHRLFEELALHQGQEISSDRKHEIEMLVVEDQSLSYAFDRLSRRMLSEKQLRDKLATREFSEEIIDETISRCKDLSLLDDRYWAETCAREALDLGFGKNRAERKLREAGIEKTLSEEVLNEVFLLGEEEDLAREALQRRYKDRLNPKEQRRAYEMLLRRGFSSSSATNVVAAQAMSLEEENESYGFEEALLVLERKYRDKNPADRQKAYAFLARRSFSPGAIREALDNFFE